MLATTAVRPTTITLPWRPPPRAQLRRLVAMMGTDRRTASSPLGPSRGRSSFRSSSNSCKEVGSPITYMRWRRVHRSGVSAMRILPPTTALLVPLEEPTRGSPAPPERRSNRLHQHQQWQVRTNKHCKVWRAWTVMTMSTTVLPTAPPKDTTPATFSQGAPLPRTIPMANRRSAIGWTLPCDSSRNCGGGSWWCRGNRAACSRPMTIAAAAAASPPPVPMAPPERSERGAICGCWPSRPARVVAAVAAALW